VHEGGHALDQAPRVVVYLLDLARLHPQRGVRVLADARERDAASRLELELLVVRVLVVVVVVIVVVIVVVVGV
jgi:hypothetical protein